MVNATKGSGNETGLFAEDGRIIIEQPRKDVIKGMRYPVEYIPFHFTGNAELFKPLLRPNQETLDKLDEAAVAFGGIFRRTGPLLFNLANMSKTIAEKIKSDFGTALPVAVRGTCCSVEEHIDVVIGKKRYEVKSVKEVVETGTEKIDLTAGTKFTGVFEQTDRLPERTFQWLMESPKNLRVMLSKKPRYAGLIFPIVLVYDKAIADGPTAHYGAMLPKTDEERAKLLLKVYVLDYPHVVIGGIE